MVENLLAQFHQIASSPKSQMEKFLKDGKKIILTAPVYAPEEIIHSMGLVPMGVWGADITIKKGKEYCPAFLCSIIQSILELGINGKYRGASAIVIPSLCDTLKTLGENWKYAVPEIQFIPMVYPQNRKPDYGIKFTMDSYKQVIAELEKLGGKFSNEALLESNAIYNHHNKVMRKLDRVLAKHPEVTPSIRSDIFKSVFFMEKEEHTRMVEKLITELEEQENLEVSKIPIIISGIIADNVSLNQVFEENNMYIVADDIAAQSRQYRMDTPVGKDAICNLAEKFAKMDNCSVLYNREKPRIQWIVDMAKKRKAKGVVVVLTKFCDPEEFDYVMIKKACEKEELPLTMIEVDRQMTCYEQIRTNIETFKQIITI